VELDFDALIQMYLSEASEILDQMEHALVVLETRPADPESLETLSRGAHTLKGNSASLGFPRVADLAQGIEGRLRRMQHHGVSVSRDVIALLREAVAALRVMVPAAAAGDWVEDVDHAGIIARLELPA
jgi:two-component system chemotaxis sensor kinase CheA